MNFDPLQSTDWRKRKQAIEELHSARPEELPPRLLEIIRHNHHNLGALNAALQLLSSIRQDVVPGLLSLLQDPQAEARAYALIALAEQKDPQSIPAIIHALNDTDPNVRFNAVEALGKIQAIEAVDALTTILRERDFYLSFAALEALVKIGAPSCADEISDLLSDEILAPAAVEALGNLGSFYSVPLLLTWLDSPAGEAEAVATALVELQRHTKAQFSDATLIPRAVTEAISPLGQEKILDALESAMKKAGGGYLPVALPALVTVSGWLLAHPQVGSQAQPRAAFIAGARKHLVQLLNYPKLRDAALEALKQTGKEVIPGLILKLQDPDLETRRAALAALGSIGDPETIAVLISALEFEEGDLAAVAAGALGKIGDRSAFEPLCAQLENPSALVRQTVIAAINSLGHPQHTQRMLQLAQHSNPVVREAAIRSLGYFGEQVALETILQACQDEVIAVQQAAVDSLSLYDDERALLSLQTCFNDPSSAIRAAAARALRFAPPSFAIPLLITALQDADMWVRVYACRSLAHFRHPDIEQHLLRLTNDRLPPVRAAAAQALGEQGGKETVAVLQRMLLDPETEVVIKALHALAATHQPAAANALASLLTHPAPEIRLQVIAALGQHGSTEAVQILQQLAYKGESVEQVFEALLQAHSSEAIKTIVASLERAEVRTAAIAAAQRLGEAALPALRHLLQRPSCSPETRLTIVQVLQRIHSTNATDLLINLLADATLQVRLAAIYALSEVGSPAARSALAQLAKTDPDARVQRRAHLALQRMKCPI